MRFSSWFVTVAVLVCAGAASMAAGGDGIIGVYADLTATQTTATFAVGVPRTLFIVARLEGETAAGASGAEFRIDGLPADWFVYVTPNPTASVVLGHPFRESGGVRRANIAFPWCAAVTDGRVLLYTVVVVPTTAVEPHILHVEPGDPPTNPAFQTPVLLRCDHPNYTPVAAEGDSFFIAVRAPHDLDYSQLPEYEGARGVHPERGLPGDLFRFRVVYWGDDGLPPAPGWPRLELDANGDGDTEDPGEGAFTMSPADQDSTIQNGKEYRYDVALDAAADGGYAFRFTALDEGGTPVGGPASAWRDSLVVSAGLADLSVKAEDIRALPPDPITGEPCVVVARLENRSDRRVENVRVSFQSVFGMGIVQRTLAAIGPRSATEVTAIARFDDYGFQPVVVRIDPGGEIPESDVSNNVASHGVRVGGPVVAGRLSILGLPPQITVPLIAPFGFAGSVAYAASGWLPSSPARGARVVATPSWEGGHATRTDASGDFGVSFIAPATTGTYRLSVTASDGGRADSVIVDVHVAPSGGAPPHGPNLAVELTTGLGTGCPPGSAAISWAVENRGDLASEPTSVRLLAGGTTAVVEAPVAPLAPGQRAILDAVEVPLAGTGLRTFTAHVDPTSTIRELREDDNAAVSSVYLPPACLDLALEEMRFTGTRFCTGEALEFVARVANRGCEAALPARVACRTGGVEVASAPLPALGPGQSAGLAFFPSFAEAACRNLDLVLDPEHAAGPDCSPASDVLTGAACVGPCDPPPPPPRPNFNVVACDMSASNPRPAPGDTLRFRAWVGNLGPAHASAPVLVRFDIDGTVLGDPVQVGVLLAGERRLVQTSTTWAADFALARLTVTVDPNGQEESRNDDNTASRPLPWELRPLYITRCPPAFPAMFSDCLPCRGVPFEIRAVVANDGLFDCDSVQVEFRDVLAGGTLLADAVALHVRAGGECTAAGSLVRATATLNSTGQHRIAAVVDASNSWPEPVESNNTYAQDVQVGCAATPDLVAAVRLPPGPVPLPGDTVRAVEVRVTNRGLGSASGVTARLRLDGAILCDLGMGDVLPGATSLALCTTPWVVADSTCSQRLEACADPDQRIGETNELNNCTTTGIAAGGETDLAIFPWSIRATPPNPHVGEQVLIELGMYSLLGVESTCLLGLEWGIDGLGWFPIGEVPLHLPANQFHFPNVASFVWTMPLEAVVLRFQILDVCPFDVELGNNVALATLPWYIPPGTPVSVSDFEAESTPEGVALRWRTDAMDATFALERRAGAEAEWVRLPDPTRTLDGPGGVRWELVDRSAEPGARLEYRLLATGAGGVEILATMSVVHDAAGRRVLLLHPVRPNPFRPGGVIEFSVPEPRPVELGVFDAAGRRVALLSRGLQPAGRRTVVWEGRDDDGRRLPAGVYFCRLTSGAVQQTRRFVLVR
jgi:hypothetical protein